MKSTVLVPLSLSIAVAASASTFKSPPVRSTGPAVAPAVNELIINPPGEKHAMALYGHGYRCHDQLNMPLGQTIDAYATEMVTDGNDVYFLNPFNQFVTDTYMKGSKTSENEIVCTFPQLIYEDAKSGEPVSLYANRLKFVVEDETTGSGWFYIDPDNDSVTFTNTDEGWIMDYDEDEDVIIIGLCDSEGNWTMVGNDEMTYTEFEGSLITPPNDLKVQTWNLFSSDDDPRKIKVGIYDDTMVYIQGLSEKFPESWIEGYINEDTGKVAIPSSQYLGIDTDRNSYVYMLTVKLEQYYDEYDEVDVYEYQQVSRLNFSYDPELNIMSTDGYLFVNYGNRWLESLERILTPVLMLNAERPPVVETPSYLEYEDWILSAGSNFHAIQMAFDVNDVYVKGLSLNIPEGVIKGSIADGSVTFPTGQYLGESSEYPGGLWFLTAFTELQYDDYWDDYTKVTRLSDEMSFIYDREKKRMTTDEDNLMIINKTNDGSLRRIEEYSNPVLRRPDENASPVPANPEIIWFWEWDDYYGNGTLTTKIPNTNIDGDFLNTANLYYRYYIDNEIFNLDPDIYTGVSDSSMIPYDFSNRDNIWSSGTTHELYFEEKWITDIGIQSVYVENGREYVSDIIYASGRAQSEAKQIPSNASVSYEKVFDINGRPVEGNYNGVILKTIVFDDGSQKTIKVVNR